MRAARRCGHDHRRLRDPVGDRYRELGLKVTIGPDACATTDERVEKVALGYLVDVVGVVLEDCISARVMRRIL